MTELRYLMDTDTCIYIINRQPAEVRDRFTHLAPGSVAISVVTYHELYFGALQSRHTEKNLQALQQFTHRVPALPWSAEAAIQTARLRLALKRSGQPIGSWDMQIAGHALALNLALVTNKIREFGRIEHLRVETWVKPNTKNA